MRDSAYQTLADASHYLENTVAVKPQVQSNRRRFKMIAHRICDGEVLAHPTPVRDLLSGLALRAVRVQGGH
jgi:hypothetical protein